MWRGGTLTSIKKGKDGEEGRVTEEGERKTIETEHEGEEWTGYRGGGGGGLYHQ